MVTFKEQNKIRYLFIALEPRLNYTKRSLCVAMWTISAP